MFKRSLAHSVVRAWRLGVAVGAQRDARVVGCLHAHASVTSGMCGFAAAFDPAGTAGHFANPRLVVFVRAFVFRLPYPSTGRLPPRRQAGLRTSARTIVCEHGRAAAAGVAEEAGCVRTRLRLLWSTCLPGGRGRAPDDLCPVFGL